MEIRTLIVCMGIIFLVGCSSKNIVNKVDDETRADINKLSGIGNKLESDMVKIRKENKVILNTSIIPKKK